MSKELKTLAFIGGLIALMVIIYFAFGTQGPSPVELTKQRLRELKTAVIDYADKNKSLPKSLQELGLADEALNDHTDTPFIYKVEGDQVTILSYGADGKEGGHAFKADKEVSFKWPAE